jgi:hypothetical protein
LHETRPRRRLPRLAETLDVFAIVDSIGAPANQWNRPLKAFGWA